MKKLLAAVALLSTILVGPSITGSCAAPAWAATPCCKICKKGKACGNSCIAVDKVCHAGPGCACDR